MATTSSCSEDACNPNSLHPPQSLVSPSFAVESCDTEAFVHQVAGHTVNGDIALRKHKTGFVMKPVQSGPRGKRELEFYRSVYEGTTISCPTEVRRRLQTLTPTFFGVSNMLVNGAQEYYLMLEDALSGMKLPSVLDLKIGCITSNPEASPDKILKEKGKYTGTKEQLGISLAGMYHFDVKRNEYIRKHRHFGRTLTEESLVSTMKEFFNYEFKQSTTIIRMMVERLLAVEELFLMQEEFGFYSSSLLVAYDAHFFSKVSEVSAQSERSVEPMKDDNWATLFMIDFAHVFPLNGSSLDYNYLFGIRNLIRIFQALL